MSQKVKTEIEMHRRLKEPEESKRRRYAPSLWEINSISIHTPIITEGDISKTI